MAVTPLRVGLVQSLIILDLNEKIKRSGDDCTRCSFFPIQLSVMNAKHLSHFQTVLTLR